MNSDFKSPVNFTAGAFYEDGLVTEAVALPVNTALHLPASLGRDTVPLAIKTYSVFGQLRWEIVPRLELATGLRWSDETRTESPINGLNLSFPRLADGAPIAVLQPRVHANNDSPEIR